MDSDLKQLGDAIAAALPGAVGEVSTAYGELTLTVELPRLLEAVAYLRDDPACLFVSFIDLTAVDYPVREKRFDVVTHLLSPKHNRRIRVKVATDEETPVPSLSDLYPAANWFEREAYDLFGVLFSGHPDLRRLLTDYGFDGHPLRKDFPMTGYVEVRYDDERKRVVYEPVQLTQDYRSFDFLSPWEGAIDYVLPGDEKAKNNPH
ncbi:NADH-quinone oxidoreductase subunit C [Methylocapsa acidiphila]|uniref:NADH-quinone oxidoreductase subunit C n=1 Tax=Methylocapsa acidiphila TaxID=133552 RepID=UPI000402B458|nr:NADH-quinone oxidoreductase subunit C [Methylocapsa acidiphila]